MPSSEEMLSQAKAAGFEIMTQIPNIDQDAVRLLPDDPKAVVVACAGGVAHVVVGELPTPVRYSELAAATGMLITVSVAAPELFADIVAAATTQPGELIRTVSSVLIEVVERKASDAHLSVGRPPVLRWGGKLEVMDQPPLSVHDVEEAAEFIAGKDVLENFSGDHDCAISYGGARFRTNIYQQRGALAIALRRIPAQVPPLEELAIPESVMALCSLQRGLVLFIGVTGSGKTTTQAAMIDRINRTQSRHILTIEDPIEYLHEDRMSLVHQREVGEDTASFASGLRSAMREDPDVILVGEMRDAETMAAAITAAETGHLVLATVHAQDTAGAVTRIIDVFPASQQPQIRTQLASSLAAGIAQYLLPKRGEPGERQLVCEVLIATPAVRNIIRSDKLQEIPSMLEAGGEHGMCSLDRALAIHAVAGTVELSEAHLHVRDRNSFEEHLRHLRQSSGRAPTDPFSDF